jgi:hypothetical protein
MCGIVGIVALRESSLDGRSFSKGLNTLISGAERRGKDASGYIFASKSLTTYEKFPSRLSDYKTLILGKAGPLWRLVNNSESFALFLHSRMETHGSGAKSENNHPIIRANRSLLHNGIILNHKELDSWTKKQRLSETDSESFLMVLEHLTEVYPEMSTKDLFDLATSLVEGANTFVLFDNLTKEIFLSSSNGSLYLHQTTDFLIFASEKLVGSRCMEEILPNTSSEIVIQVTSKLHFRIDLSNTSFEQYSPSLRPGMPKVRDLGRNNNEPRNATLRNAKGIWLRLQQIVDSNIAQVSRCRLCLLPENYPGLAIEPDGNCNFCRDFQTIVPPSDHDKSIDLKRKLEFFGDLSGRKVLVPFSGGRDSSFLLHKLKVDFDLDVTAFTYDWGFVTDTARRNISRMCGELEIEHLLISADIRKKRKNVALNVRAWLARPHPGIIPLFMAGDKDFFRVASTITREYEFDAIIFGMNRQEPASFKTSMMGIDEKPGNDASTFAMSLKSVIGMMNFYGAELILNPRLFNHSILDTLVGFYSYYLKSTDYYNFYDFYPWRLAEIEQTLKNIYNWEGFDSPMGGWRNGDATAPFYNLLYNLILGYNENNVLVANLLRSSQINHSSAAELLSNQQSIDVEGIHNYFGLIQVEAEPYFESLISKNNLKRIFG